MRAKRPLTDEETSQLNLEYQRMVDWLKETVRGKGFDNVVIGLSGGFDSSFIAYMACEALHPRFIHGVSMPCRLWGEDHFSWGESVHLAQELAHKLDIRYDVQDISTIVSVFLHGREELACRPMRWPPMTGLRVGNIKARVRMTTLYDTAAAVNGLVLNTCNASETFSGNETKFGDSAGDLSPLGNYLKTRLYDMALACGFAEKFHEIYSRVPTPELEDKPDHNDETNMGCTYPQMDKYLETTMLVPGVACEDIVLDEELRKKIKKKVESSSHKYTPMPTFSPRSWQTPAPKPPIDPSWWKDESSDGD